MILCRQGINIVCAIDIKIRSSQVESQVYAIVLYPHNNRLVKRLFQVNKSYIRDGCLLLPYHENYGIVYVTQTLHFASRTRFRSSMFGLCYGTQTLHFKHKIEYLDVSDSWTRTSIRHQYPSPSNIGDSFGKCFCLLCYKSLSNQRTVNLWPTYC